MNEEFNVSEVVSEVEGATKEELDAVIKRHFKQVRALGIEAGAKYMASAIYSVVNKHTTKNGKVSLRDYERMKDEIVKVVSVLLTQQNDSNEVNDGNGGEYDGTAE